jgi:hypothetical protein
MWLLFKEVFVSSGNEKWAKNKDRRCIELTICEKIRKMVLFLDKSRRGK